MIEDRTEQSQDAYAFVTPETMDRATMLTTKGKLATRTDQLLIWAESGKLPATWEDIITDIRNAISIVREGTGLKSQYYGDRTHSSGGSLSDEPEPPEVSRYLSWSRSLIERKGVGYAGLYRVQDAILDGTPCDYSLFRLAMRAY